MTINVASLFREHRWLIVLSLAYVLLGTLRLNDLSVYTDSTRYVIWGTSFAHAKGFVDETQPEPERYVVNAPFFAVVLSPALLLFPNSLLAAKIWTLLLGIAFILLFYSFLRRFFGTTPAILGILPIVFNPLVVLLSTEVLSETTFLGAVALCFLLLERLELGDPAKKRDLVLLLLVTSFVVLLREVAITLVGAIVLYLLVRKQYRKAILLIFGFALLFGLWLYRNLVLVGAPPDSQATNVNFIFGHFLTPPQASLLEEFGLRVASNVSGYALQLVGLIFYPLPDVLIVEPSGLFLAYYKAMSVIKYIIPVIFLPLLFLGIWRDLTDRKTGIARLVFLVSYLLVILCYPVRDVRFLLPVFPIQIFYLIAAIRWMRDGRLQGTPRLIRILALCLGGVVVLPNLLCLYEIENTNLKYTSNPLAFYDHLQQVGANRVMFTKPWRILGDTIRRHTPDGSIIAGSLKEASIFIDDRKLLELNNAVPVTTFEQYLRTYSVDYVMATTSVGTLFSYEFQMGESKRYWFEPISGVAGMRLYKVHHTFLTPRETWMASKRVEIDTTGSNGLLRLGRLELVRGNYDHAIALLQKAQALAPAEVMIPYQMLVAYALSGRLEEASKEMRTLYGYGQSTSYIPLASKHLDAAYAQRRMESSESPAERSTSQLNAARFYWSLGYYGQAYTTIRGSLFNDPTYFAGLLWGWDYAMQRGDTVQANAYLRQLKSIDRSNVVVQQFALIEQTEDSLHHSVNPQQRSAFYLAIARSYKSVDLPGEAIDEAQRSLREDPRNGDAWLFQAQLFEDKKMPFAARSAYQHLREVDPLNTIAATKLSHRTK